MPEFEVTSPEGKKFRVNAPEGATREQAIAYVRDKYGAPSLGPVGGLAKGFGAAATDMMGLPADLANLPIKNIATDVDRVIQSFTNPPKNKAEEKAFLKGRDTGVRIPLGSQDFRGYIQDATQAAGLPKSTFTYKDTSELPDTERPFAIAGEAIGTALAPERLISKLAKVPGAVENAPAFLRSTIKFAKEAPKAFRALERAAATGAGLGGAVTSTMTDDPKKIAAGEIVGSFLSPTALAMRMAGAGGHLADEGISAIKSLFTGKSDYKAAKYLQKTLIEHGEDPAKLAQILHANEGSNLSLTSGQWTRSPVLLQLEDQFARRNSRFGKIVEENTKNSLESLRVTADRLQATGDPEALRAAAKLRQTYFDRLLNHSVDEAKADLMKAAAKLTPESRVVAGDVSAEAFDVLSKSLGKAREQESKLWGEIPKDVPANFNGTMTAARDAKATYLPETEVVPSGLSSYFKSVKANDGTISWVWKLPKTTTGDLAKLRSTSLKLAREAQASGDWKNAGLYGKVAEGALEDLSKIPGIQKPLQNARDYSRALHDAFTRTFAGDVLRKDATGAALIEPETLLRRTLGAGAEGGSLRFDQLLKAAKFGDERLAGAMRGIQERYLRQNARRLVDPATGKVSPASLANFMRDNEALLDQFPNLKADYKDVQSAQRALDASEALRDKATKAMQQRALFGQLVKNEDPVYVVGQALRTNPISNYAQLSRFAKAEGAEATAGLRTSTIQHAYNDAFDSSGELSWTKFKQNLTAPIGKGRVSMLDLMRQNGVISPQEESRLMEVVSRGENIEDALRHGSLEVSPPQEDMLSDLIIATGASKLGKIASKPLGGTTLVAQSAFTKAGRKLFEKLPNARVMDFIMDATQNPKTMAMLLEKPTSAQQAKSLMGRVQDTLERGGYTPKGSLFAAGEEANQSEPMQ